jgi:hypothetical protein
MTQTFASCIYYKLSHREIVSGLTFLKHGQNVPGLADAVICVEHAHTGLVQRTIALLTASEIKTQIIVGYTEYIATQNIALADKISDFTLEVQKARADLICSLFAVFMVCRLKSSFSVLEIHDRADNLSGLRDMAQRQCAESWATSILAESEIMEYDSHKFVKLCISGAVGCLAYCRASGQLEQYNTLFGDHGITGALSLKARECYEFGDSPNALPKQGNIRIVLREIFVDKHNGATLERTGGVATIYTHVPEEIQITDILSRTRINYQSVARLLGDSKCEVFFKVKQSLKTGVLEYVSIDSMCGIALKEIWTGVEIIMHFRIVIEQHAIWFKQKNFIL